MSSVVYKSECFKDIGKNRHILRIPYFPLMRMMAPVNIGKSGAMIVEVAGLSRTEPPPESMPEVSRECSCKSENVNVNIVNVVPSPNGREC